MFDLDRLSKLRFGMSEVPKVGGQRGTYEEKWGQWFLESDCFRRLESLISATPLLRLKASHFRLIPDLSLSSFERLR